MILVAACPYRWCLGRLRWLDCWHRFVHTVFADLQQTIWIDELCHLQLADLLQCRVAGLTHLYLTARTNDDGLSIFEGSGSAVRSTDLFAQNR